MRTARTLALTLTLVLASADVALSQPREKDDGKFFFFKDGDVVVVMGDSITEQHLYSNYLEAWSVCRFPKRQLTFRNVGISGDTAPGGNGRFKRDVLEHKATVLTVDFGMNDANRKPADKAFENYIKGLEGIAAQAKAAKIRVAWITPQPIEKREVGSAFQGYNEALARFSEGVRDIAHKHDGLFVDQFHPYLAVLAKARATDPKNINITGGDAVHPGPPGQVVMAAAILKGLDFQRLVSRVVIDLKEGKLEVENCEAQIVKKSDNALTFTRHDFALPYFPESARSILKWTPLLDDMNRYGLQVAGLAPGRYAVSLNDQKVGEYSSQDLARGVNMANAALSAGPVAEQVKKVYSAIEAKNKYFHDQIFRGVVLGKPKDGDPKVLYAERMKKMPELDAAVRQSLEWKAHTVSLTHLGN